MLVVADSSPINILVRIECIHVLSPLFQTVCIPLEVLRELSEPRTPDAVRKFIAAPPPWLQVQAPRLIESIPPLDAGEAAAISLARELKADALLIDERDGRKAAAARGIAIVGTLGVLERAALRQLIDLPQAIDRLKTTDFRLDRALIEAALRRHTQQKPPN